MIVAVLAGGRGRRMGGSKPLRRRAADRAATGGGALDAVVLAKRGTPLPEGLEVCFEPDEPFHPLVGIVTALERADGPVVAMACDQPFVPGELLARLAARPEAAPTVDGRIEPIPARYDLAWLPDLRAALQREAPVRATLEALAPQTVEFGAAPPRSLDTPEDLARE